MPPVLVYLVDSLGFRAVFRPKAISYDDGRTATGDGDATSRVPSRAVLFDVRDGDDTLRIELSIEDAIATDTPPSNLNGKSELKERGDPRANRDGCALILSFR